MKYLLVANQTLGGPNLMRAVRRRIAKGPCRFHVLVPAPGPLTMWDSTMAAVAGELPGDEASIEEAGRRLGVQIARLRKVGAEVDGEIGDPDPIAAIDAALEREAFDEIILSTARAGPSRWVGADLPTRIERHVDLPVHTIHDGPPRLEPS